MALKEKVFLNRDNAIKLGLLVDGTPVSANTLTRIVVKLTDSDGNVTTIDSNSGGNSAAFDTTQTAQVSDVTTNILIMRLQDADTPPAVGDDYMCDLILYDAVNTDGIHWDSPFPVEVISG